MPPRNAAPPNCKEESPLSLAAAALEAELAHLESLARAARKIPLTSEKNITRAAKDLQELLALPERLAAGLQSLASAMASMQANKPRSNPWQHLLARFNGGTSGCVRTCRRSLRWELPRQRSRLESRPAKVNVPKSCVTSMRSLPRSHEMRAPCSRSPTPRISRSWLERRMR